MNSSDDRKCTANPLLLLVSGLCPVLIPSFTFQSGFVMGLGVALHATILAALVPLLARMTNPALRYPVALSFSAVIATVHGMAVRFLFPAFALGLAPFIAFLALNCFGLSVMKGSLRQDSLERFSEYAKAAALSFVTVIAFAGLRELLGSGMITFYRTEKLRVVLDLRSVIRLPLRMALLPSGAFILLGYAIAGNRMWAARRRGIKA